MKLKKEFKIYYHNLLFLKASNYKPNRNKNKIFSLLFYPWLVIHAVFKRLYGFCFITGSLIINICVGFIRIITNDILKTRDSLKQRLKILLSPQLPKSVALFLAISIFALVGFKSLDIIATAIEIKNKVTESALLGGRQLLEGGQLLKQQDFDLAQNKFILAYKSFAEGQNRLSYNSKLISDISEILPQKRDAARLLDAASQLSQAGNEMVEFYKNFSGIEISSGGITSRKQSKELYAVISLSLNKLNKRLSSASDLIGEVNENNVPESYRQNFLELKSSLLALQKSFSSLKEVTEIFQKLTEGKKHTLVLFLNNNELRAGGGFIGTYGEIRSNYGSIEKMEVSSIYDLDGQLTAKIGPPIPILNVNDRWYLRDSNWFLDFAQNAKKAIAFYEKEGKETPDQVIAFTPNLIVDLLKITGPVDMPDYGVSLTAENFVENAQVISSVLYPDQENKPKQILADFIPLLLQKLSAFDSNAWALVFEALQKNLSEKQISIYSRDQDTQEILQTFNWAGEALQTDRDYLSIIASNLGGTKSDSFIEQSAALKTTISDEGKIINELAITRKNLLPDLANTENTSFLRIYVPEGSRLIENTGFDYINLDHLKNTGYKSDPDIYALEKFSHKDVVTGTTIGIESEKTYFGNWLKLKGGEKKTVKITYELPFELTNIDRYSVLFQKQLGSGNTDIDWEITFSGRRLDWHNFENPEININSLNADFTLNRDYLLGGVFSLR